MTDRKLDDEDKKNQLLTEICQRLEREARNKLEQKIPRFQVTAYNTYSSIDLIGEVIFSSKISFVEKMEQRWNMIMGGFDSRKDSLKNRTLTESEKNDLEKFIFNFCCVNSLKFKPCEEVVLTDLADPKAVKYRIEMIEDLFPVSDKL